MADKPEKLGHEYDDNWRQRELAADEDPEKPSDDSSKQEGGSKTDSPDALKRKEESGLPGIGDTIGKGGISDKVGKGFTSGNGSGMLGGGFKVALNNRNKLIAGSGIIFILIAAIALFMLFGSLKQIHFDTVLRSTGMAVFQRQMARQFARTTFHAATLTANSTGRPTDLPDRSLLDRLRRVNPEKQLKALGRDGHLKFTFEGSSRWGGIRSSSALKSVTVNGKTFALDDFSRGRGYNNLSWREKITARNEFVRAIQKDLSTVQALNERAARSSAYKGLRQVTGIRMTKWSNKARDYLGKDIKEAKKLNTSDTSSRISGNGGPRSVIPGVNEVVDDMKAGNGSEKANLMSERAAQNFARMQRASMVVLGSTVVCIVHDLNSSFTEGAKEREMQMARTAHDSLTTADQTKEGDTVYPAVVADGSRYDEGQNAIYYKQVTGGEVTDRDKEQLASVPGLKPVSHFAKGIAAADESIDAVLSLGISEIVPFSATVQDYIQDKLCSAVLNKYVQIAIAGAEITGTVIGSFMSFGGAAAGKIAVHGAIMTGIKNAAYFAGTVGLGEMLGKLIQTQIDNFAAYSGTETGTQLVNNNFASMDLLAQTGTRNINYGRPLTEEEATKARDIALADLQADMNSLPLKQRYFALSNPYSLTGKLVANTPSSLPDASIAVTRSFASIFSAPQKFVGSIFSQKVHADDSIPPPGISAGVTMNGWTEEEWERIMTEESFSPVPVNPNDSKSPLENYYADHQNDMDGGKTFYEKYEACYPVLQHDIPDYCTPSYLGTDLALHWRAYNSDLLSADWLSREDLGMESEGNPTSEDGESTSEPAAGAEIVGNPFESSVDVACAEGTKDVGVHDAYNNGRKIKMRMCAVENLPCDNEECVEIGDGKALVNSRVSGAVYAMVEAAKADGITLRANSSFRTMAHQQALCPCDGISVARPGYSNHQSGNAIDFADAGNSKIPGATCSSRARDDGSAVWVWLSRNASRFGYKQYAAESWHWDPMEAMNRC